MHWNVASCVGVLLAIRLGFADEAEWLSPETPVLTRVFGRVNP